MPPSVPPAHPPGPWPPCRSCAPLASQLLVYLPSYGLAQGPSAHSAALSAVSRQGPRLLVAILAPWPSAVGCSRCKKCGHVRDDHGDHPKALRLLCQCGVPIPGYKGPPSVPRPFCPSPSSSLTGTTRGVAVGYASESPDHQMGYLSDQSSRSQSSSRGASPLHPSMARPHPPLRVPALRQRGCCGQRALLPRPHARAPGAPAGKAAAAAAAAGCARVPPPERGPAHGSAAPAASASAETGMGRASTRSPVPPGRLWTRTWALRPAPTLPAWASMMPAA